MPDVRGRPRANLGGSLALVLPSLAPELVSAESASRLAGLAAVLPPVHVAGFECRLALGDGRIDLQQGIFQPDGEPAIAARFIRHVSHANSIWERVRDICDAWSEPGTAYHAGIGELWLEVDAPAPGGARPHALDDVTPSVFAVLRPNAEVTNVAVASDLLGDLVAPEHAERLRAQLHRCAAACPAGTEVSHLGVMLGRGVAAMRVHVSPLPLDRFGAYLAAIAWPGDAAPVEDAARLLLDHGDLVVLCLDVAGDLLPQLGLECFFNQKQGLDPRWPPLLASLVALGLGTPEKAAALLQWPGRMVAAEGPEAWPDDLIAQSIGRPEDEFSAIERRLSHVKLSLVDGLPPTAKAYFGFGHVRARYTAPTPEPVRPAVRPAASVQDAIAAALDRLLAARNQGGWWRDFFDRGRPRDVDRRVTGYASDEWVTAYVAAVLARVPERRARAAAEHALLLLMARRQGGSGWGYHALLPPDADTTTWVLRLAGALDAPESERLLAARRFVRGLTGATGGVATYEEGAAIQLAEFLRMGGSYAGWCGTHTCVTAAAAALGLDASTPAFLVTSQRLDGSWTGHWWDDDEYTTARAVEALALSGGGGHPGVVPRATAWLAGRVGADGSVRSLAQGGVSPFATALALQGIVFGPVRDGSEEEAGARRAVRWLLANQRADGSWAPSARLRVPAPATTDPRAAPETTLTYVDDDAVFTTATVLASLVAAVARRPSVAEA